MTKLHRTIVQAWQRRCLLVILFVMTTSGSSCYADWPQFRGPNGSGIAGSGSLPAEFGPGKNEKWRTPLASGHSSPCIVGNKIFLTTYAAEQKRLALVCLDRDTGVEMWQQAVATKEVETGHPSFNPASSTPCADFSRVVAYFGSFGLICFDHKGAKQWEFALPLARSYAGNATSPIITGDRIILYRGNHKGHFLLALSKVTGEELWRVPQEEPFTDELACTACPIVLDDKLIVHSARSVQAFELESGKRIWEAKCATTATSTPVLYQDQVLVAAWNKMGEPALRPEFPSFKQLVAAEDRDEDGTISRDELPKLWIFHRPEGAEAPQNGATIRFARVDADQDGEITNEEWSSQLAKLEVFRRGYDTHGLLSIGVDGTGLLTNKDVRVLETIGIPEVPSPVSDGQFLYMIKNGGVLTCLDLESGQRTSRMRTGGRGTHYASPIVGDDKLFTFAGDGRVSVLTLGAKPEIIATNELGEPISATPAIDEGVIFIRTHKALYAFEVASQK